MVALVAHLNPRYASREKFTRSFATAGILCGSPCDDYQVRFLTFPPWTEVVLKNLKHHLVNKFSFVVVVTNVTLRSLSTSPPSIYGEIAQLAEHEKSLFYHLSVSGRLKRVINWNCVVVGSSPTLSIPQLGRAGGRFLFQRVEVRGLSRKRKFRVHQLIRWQLLTTLYIGGSKFVGYLLLLNSEKEPPTDTPYPPVHLFSGESKGDGYLPENRKPPLPLTYSPLH